MVRKLPESIHRAKGVVYAAEASDRRAVLEALGRQVDISTQVRWRTAPRMRLVVIGPPTGVDARQLHGVRFLRRGPERSVACRIKHAIDSGA